MKTNHLFLAFAFTLIVSGSNVFAQSNVPNDPLSEQKRPTPEQMIDFRVKRMQNSLMLDEETATKFTPIYKEYLQALTDCMKPTDKQIKEIAECTDEDILKRIENSFEKQQQILDTKKKYFKSFKKILNARQLQKVFAERPHHFMNKPWAKPDENRNIRLHSHPCHKGHPDVCPPCQY